MIRAILFDAAGTLFFLTKTVGDHYAYVGREVGLDLDAQDLDRAITLLNYAWTLYEQQDESLKRLYPLQRPRIRQSFDKMELADGGVLLALPGKDPSKIRGEHPTIVVIDEASFIQEGAEAFDVALSSRVPRMLVVSSAAPGWFRRLTKLAQPISLDEYL